MLGRVVSGSALDQAEKGPDSLYVSDHLACARSDCGSQDCSVAGLSLEECSSFDLFQIAECEPQSVSESPFYLLPHFNSYLRPSSSFRLDTTLWILRYVAEFYVDCTDPTRDLVRPRVIPNMWFECNAPMISELHDPKFSSILLADFNTFMWFTSKWFEIFKTYFYD